MEKFMGLFFCLYPAKYSMTTILYDWAAVTRQDIIDHLRPISYMLTNQPLDIDYLYDIFSKKLKEKYPVSTKKIKRVKSMTGKMSIGGRYYPCQDKVNKKSIYVIFSFNTRDSAITITGKTFNRLLALIADTIMHEMIHMKQYRKRNFQSLDQSRVYAAKDLTGTWQRYYGQYDEIDAHAFNIACELINKFKSIDIIRDFLDCNKQSNTLYMFATYLQYFDNNHDHKIIKLLKKKIRHYIPYALIGKPFKRLPRSIVVDITR